MAHSDFYEHGGLMLPSVSIVLQGSQSVCDAKKEKGLSFWRHTNPNHKLILSDAQIRGKLFHAESEMALTGETEEEFEAELYVKYNIPGYVEQAIPIFEEIKEENKSSPIIQEKTVYFPGLYAGTPDIRCWFRGQYSVCDWKSTRSYKELQLEVEQGLRKDIQPKSRSHYASAFLQTGSYAAGINFTRFMPWTPDEPKVTQLVIFVIYDWREPQIHIADLIELKKNVGLFADRLNVYRALYGAPVPAKSTVANY